MFKTTCNFMHSVPNGRTLVINLFSPGMTMLHKAGLAGLWMTLEALEKENEGIASFQNGSGSWERTDYSVSLHWHNDPDTFFETLFEKSFKIDSNGLLWFPGLGNPANNLMHAAILQEAVLGSFLQHGRTRQSDPSQQPNGDLSFQIDKFVYSMKFHRIKYYIHQDAKFQSQGINTVTGWLIPGGVVRHSGFGAKSTALEESPAFCLALRFAPVGVIYFKIESLTTGHEPHFCLVMPEITNLKDYAVTRKIFTKYELSNLQLAGAVQAGLEVLAELEVAKLTTDKKNIECRVISFGTVPWSSQQKTRVEIETVKSSSKTILEMFRNCRILFKARLINTKNGRVFWNIPQLTEFVARNLNSGRKWWEGFAEFAGNKALREHIVNYEKEGLGNMINKTATFEEGPERKFVFACQEAWHRRLGQIGKNSRLKRSSFSNQANREFTNQCLIFSQCKTEDSFRTAVINFWVKSGGPIKPLQEGWRDILPLLSGKNWKKGKDLALLSLVSYKSSVKNEDNTRILTDTKGD